MLLAAGNLFEVIALLQKLFGEKKKIRGSNISFFALKHAVFLKQCHSQNGLTDKNSWWVDS